MSRSKSRRKSRRRKSRRRSTSKKRRKSRKKSKQLTGVMVGGSVTALINGKRTKGRLIRGNEKYPFKAKLVGKTYYIQPSFIVPNSPYTFAKLIAI